MLPQPIASEQFCVLAPAQNRQTHQRRRIIKSRKKLALKRPLGNPNSLTLREAKENTLSNNLVSPPPVKKKSLLARIKEEALHYWHGSKLLWAETKISSRLLIKVLYGTQLSRREYRQVWPPPKYSLIDRV